MMTLAVLLSLLNVLGGRGWFPLDKFICRMVAMPLAAAWYLGFGWYTTIVLFAGFALWAVPGHGKYFAAYHGRYDPKEPEIWWIDSLGAAFFPNDGKGETNRNRGVLCMGLRGMFLAPMFALLGYPILAFMTFLQGFCYGAGRYVPERYGAMVGEGLTGALIGGLLWGIA